MGGLAGISGTALAGCKDDDKHKDKENGKDKEKNNGQDCPDHLPGQENGKAVGHEKDEGDSGGEAHDRDEDREKPGRRIGHCKYD